MRWLVPILILLIHVAAPSLVVAQEEDEGRIVRFLEDRLSDGAARQVDIQGFRGALTSTAELDRLVISDAEGPWLIVEEAELEWSRRALLRGELLVDALTAARLELRRLPETEDTGLDLPPAEATPFQLPELPIRIRIDRTAIAEVDLGAPILGIAARLSVEGAANLADGAGAADLAIRRLGGPRGVFELDATYDNTDRQLSLELLVEEAANGLIAELFNLPDRPSLRLSAVGDGPLTAFRADIELETDGAERLAGSLTSLQDEDTGDQRVEADLSGDISPLILPEYRAFFGNDVVFQADVTRDASGAVDVDRLRLRSAALALEGRLSLAADGQPTAFDISGRIADAGGQPVRLPLPDTDLRLDGATLGLRFDAATGNAYRARLALDGFDGDGLSIERSLLQVNGQIDRVASGELAVSAAVDAALSGLQHVDPALGEALGSEARVTGQISWLEGAPAFLTDLDASSGTLGLTGTAAMSTAGTGLDLTLDVQARAADLSRFAAVAETPLAGAVTARLAGTAELLSGAFDLALSGTGTELRFADGLPPQILAGETTLDLAAQRDATGLTLERLTLDGAEVSLQGNGRVSSGTSTLTVEARLADIGRFAGVIRGPATASLSLDRQGEAPWQVAADLTGPAGISATLGGRLGLPDGAVDLSANGRLPLSLANPLIRPRSVAGTLGFDLALTGQPTLANLSGRFSSASARVSLPVLQTALENVAANGSLSAGRMEVTVGGTLASGGALSATGSIDVLSPSLTTDLRLSGSDLRLVDPELYNALITRADMTVRGGLNGSLQVSGDVQLGETELRVPETGLGGATAIPDIRHVGESTAQRQTRRSAGLLQSASSGGSQNIGLDLTIAAPGRVFIRGRGLDAELGGTLRIGGTSANVIPAGRFDLIRGRLSILGTRLDLEEGSATLQGSFDPFIRLLATSRSNGYRIGVNVIGPISAPEITFTSDPALPEDEVLAQLLFGRSVSALSPIQLLRLADAAASLAGGSTEAGLFANLREGIGLDDLDLQTDEQGNAAVRAGRYLSENVYTDVTLGAEGDADLSLNIDLTPDITARGTFSSDGSSSLGVFFERDY